MNIGVKVLGAALGFALAVGVGMGLGAKGVRAQSFSCEMAHTKDEEAVCHSRWLRQLDTIMADQYLALKKYAQQLRQTQPEKARTWRKMLARGQQAFVAARAECGGDVACIGKVYEKRIGALVHMWREMMR